jgi:hypothetical protein
MNHTTPPRIKKLLAAKQRRLDELLDKNAGGTITAKEQARLQLLVDEAEALMVENGKLLAEFARTQQSKVPATAVPVTVWVTPNEART